MTCLSALTLANGWGQPAARTPDPDGPCVLVLAATLPQPLTPFAVHTWFVGRADRSADWERWEVWQDKIPTRARASWGYVHKDLWSPLRGVGGGEPWLLAEVRGDDALRLLGVLRDRAPGYRYADAYLAYPGPNSNTYVDAMLREAEVDCDLPATAIGKDYRGAVGATWTSGGTGVQVESPLVGLRLGLREGVQVHVLSLAFGVDLWPPALVLPLGDGRLGFDDQ